MKCLLCCCCWLCFWFAAIGGSWLEIWHKCRGFGWQSLWSRRRSSILCMANQLIATWGLIWICQMVLKHFSRGLQVQGAIFTASNSSKFNFWFHLWSPARTAHKIYRFWPIWAIKNGLKNSNWQLGRLDNLWMGTIGLKLMEFWPFLLLQLLSASRFLGAPWIAQFEPIESTLSTAIVQHSFNQI